MLSRIWFFLMFYCFLSSMDINAATICFLSLLFVPVIRCEERTENVLLFSFRSEHKVLIPSFAVAESCLVNEMMECLTFCVERPWCKSGNLQTTPNINGLYVCEALSSRNEYDFNSWLVENSTFNYFRLKTPCELSQNKTCRNGGDCIFANQTFQCKCPSLGITGETCEQVCDQPLGMEDGRILLSQITASSSWTNEPGGLPYYGRLNYVYSGQGIGAWAAGIGRTGEYLQVDLASSHIVTKIATQGRTNNHQWVTKYAVAFSNDGQIWSVEPDAKIYDGNTDGTSVVTNALARPIMARYFRVVVKGFYDYPVLRVELYGCIVA